MNHWIKTTRHDVWKCLQIDNNIRFSDGAQWNHVSACLLNGGGVRASIDERTRNGASLRLSSSHQ